MKTKPSIFSPSAADPYNDDDGYCQGCGDFVATEYADGKYFCVDCYEANQTQKEEAE